MLLAVPLLILTIALALAWGFGWLARGRSAAVRWALAALGVGLLVFLPLVYDAHVYDGNCYGLDGTPSPCTLEERLWQSFEQGLPFTIPPALLWLAAFFTSARMSPTGSTH